MNLNRVFINIECEEDCILNYNYQYKLLQVLYSAYSFQNQTNAKIFHDEGFNIDNKKFKLINTCLMFEDANFLNEGIELKKCENVKIMLSGVEDVINEIVKGLLKMHKVIIDNCNFTIEGVSTDKKKINYKKTILYKVLTMVIESIYENGKIKYLSIYNNKFYNALAQNLRRKYKLIYNEDFDDELFFDIENILTVKKKKINNIKDNGYLVGYGNFNIWIYTSVKMQKVIYYCGIGQNNTLGAGVLINLTSK
ncbi:CRISPR-associated protein Cas6 [Clostridium carboxidivorans P7]|uniref:CRISPR-associated protein Cas6 n=1 Tax=Clostridium carboxidivorans P7 TaxID=536227 RepID=C6PRK2_9CLOT|nr:CRISPR-associated endoribonuclease Cas6 [Clostridium carboxidivorans]AKN31464.1 CRISPR-associated protein Cas6 [Clostridium carboxidivorans P7]EET88183.1 CRISPR-associated protein Cas6 [Clostridium carboxidivorans P7]EFG87142.1 CRISPR-associated endoribonuclease Cas6 [Clostridium carboxidivorans P7]